jgi:signal peptidase II
MEKRTISQKNNQHQGRISRILSLSEIILCSSLLLFLLALDQLTKGFFFAKHAVLDFGWLTLHLVTNTGASFGMFQGYGIILLVLSITALVVIGWYFPRASRGSRIPLVFIAAGILGNLLNRIAYGFVIDFIDLHWWPVFNAADSCIFVGVVWLCIVLLWEDGKNKKKGKKNRP